MDENIQDIDLVNNDVIDEPTEDVETIDSTETQDTDNELEELRAFKANVEKQNAIKRRLEKKAQTSSKPHSTNTDDLAEVKFFHKVELFAEENGLTRQQARKVLSLYPEATQETLRDPFVQAGIKALEHQKRFNAVPGVSNTTQKVGGKTFSEMSENERKANWEKMVGGK